MPVVMHRADCTQVCGWALAAQARNRTPGSSIPSPDCAAEIILLVKQPAMHWGGLNQTPSRLGLQLVWFPAEVMLDFSGIGVLLWRTCDAATWRIPLSCAATFRVAELMAAHWG